MSAFETATEFFHACETLQGWAGCKKFAAPEALFSAQCEPLTDIHSAEGYCDWMADLGKGPLEGCEYELHSSSWDEENQTAIFFATITGTHSGEGGPVPPTQQQTQSQYIYVLTMNGEGKVERMCKVWNASWTLRELGWT